MSVASPALAARAYSAKVDGVRLAVASLLSSNVPACVEGATALLRDVASAGRQCSTLQVVRIVCLAARVERDAAGVHRIVPTHTARRQRAAATRTRRVGSTVGRETSSDIRRNSPLVLTPARVGVSQVLSAGQKWC